jgi:hypothetical protein
MIDLIAHGVPLGVEAGRERVEIPSISFWTKCAETLKARKPEEGPIAPP